MAHLLWGRFSYLGIPGQKSEESWQILLVRGQHFFHHRLSNIVADHQWIGRECLQPRNWDGIHSNRGTVSIGTGDSQLAQMAEVLQKNIEKFHV